MVPYAKNSGLVIPRSFFSSLPSGCQHTPEVCIGYIYIILSNSSTVLPHSVTHLWEVPIVNQTPLGARETWCVANMWESDHKNMSTQEDSTVCLTCILYTVVICRLIRPCHRSVVVKSQLSEVCHSFPQILGSSPAVPMVGALADWIPCLAARLDHKVDETWKGSWTCDIDSVYRSWCYRFCICWQQAWTVQPVHLRP